MAIGSAYSSALSGMNLAAAQLLSGINGAASGNMDKAVQAVQSEQMAQMQFSASATVMNTQNQILGSLLDISV